MLYFSYGSNMSTRRLIDRVPSAKFISVASLSEHKLKFHKKSKYGSAKCDAFRTNDSIDVMYGVIFEILASEKPALDEKEGINNGYEEKHVTVVSDSGEKFTVVTYYATNIDASLKPCDWYIEHVLRGAQEHGLPIAYIEEIKAIESIPDPDNYEKEMQIYR
ncbi:MAG: gamma-glutamylcyclotransferase [Candidatus Thiodiazotropha sp. (ex Lucinoma borealis)]|nr:gamma-glutamylcyclotransferase [Candidatus Thiodiazotropha sp. (ex Lucinoma borealis)]